MKTKLVIFITALIFLVVVFGGLKMTGNVISNGETKVKLETNHGNIVIQLYDEMPVTAGILRNLLKKVFTTRLFFIE